MVLSSRAVRALTVAAASLLLVLGLAPAARAAVTYTPSQVADCSGDVRDVDASNRVLLYQGNYFDPAGTLCGGGTSVRLQPLPGGGFPDTQPYAVNAAGVSVGDATASSDEPADFPVTAVRWAADGSVTALPLPAAYPAGYTLTSTARGINTAGTAVGWVSGTSPARATTSKAVLWTGDTARVLANYGRSTQATAISTTGVVVGRLSRTAGAGLRDGDSATAARWKTPDKLVDLRTLRGYGGSAAAAVNANAVTVGTAFGDGLPTRAVRWSRNGVLVALPQLPGAIASRADDINNSGVIAGSVTTADKVVHPVVWDAAGRISELPLLPELAYCIDGTPNAFDDECHFAGPLSITPKGVVAGTYSYYSGIGEYFRGWPTVWSPGA